MIQSIMYILMINKICLFRNAVIHMHELHASIIKEKKKNNNNKNLKHNKNLQ